MGCAVYLDLLMVTVVDVVDLANVAQSAVEEAECQLPHLRDAHVSLRLHPRLVVHCPLTHSRNAKWMRVGQGWEEGEESGL